MTGGGEGGPAPLPGGGVGGRPRVLLFAGLLGLWTWKLLSPDPVPGAVSAQLGGELKFYLAKGLHVGAYALLAAFALTLPVPRYWRWYLVGLLALHGVATEVGQTFVPGRTGSRRDVLLDWLGVALGAWAGRAARRVRPPGS